MGEVVELGPDTSWGSHLVPLMACVTATRGPILEMGVGHWSTPLLHRYCVAGGRKLVSVDEDASWIEKFTEFRVCEHTVEAVKYNDFIEQAARQQWGVVFLDQSPGWRRGADALILRECAEFIVVHDYSGAEVSDEFNGILGEWAFNEVARFSPSSLVLSRSLPMPNIQPE